MAKSLAERWAKRPVSQLRKIVTQTSRAGAASALAQIES
jgi:hypothetical protein